MRSGLRQLPKLPYDQNYDNPLNYNTIRTTTTPYTIPRSVLRKPPKLPYDQDYDNPLNYHANRTTTTP